MPIETNLNQSPYFDDTDPKKNFHRVLFKPSVAVQVREMNHLQALFQQQIERMGDNLFTKGTIIDGCNFAFYPAYPYIKIKDVEVSGVPALPSRYVNYVLENESSGLKAFALKYQDGFEATNPDLKTLYLKYLNSGSSGNTFAFTAGDVLKVSDLNSGVWDVDIIQGSLGYTNSDSVIVSSALVVNVSSGAFTNGEYITNSSNAANLQIVGIDANTLASSNQVILQIKPRYVDLTNTSANATAWTIANSDSIKNISATVAATVERLIGGGMEAEVITNGIGKVTDILVTNSGSGYSVSPKLSIQTANGGSDLDIVALNYLTKITVASVANAVGNGYAFGVSEGVIYQKGHFVRVDPQVIVVQKYHQAPNNVAVGFVTSEEIITSDQDTSLLDNAFTEENENAPGADRLKLTPSLTAVNRIDAASNAEFFSIVEWSEGQPYRQKQFTQYNKIGDAIARGISDTAGNFVRDPFLLSSRYPLSQNSEADYSSLVVDPGKAYIDGREITTYRNYSTDIRNGLDDDIHLNQVVSLDYGGYITISNMSGIFQFNTGDVINLYSDVAATAKIGEANCRMLLRDPNSSEKWRLYLFNVRMNLGKSFRQVLSVTHTAGAGYGLVELSQDAATGANVAEISFPETGALLFWAGVDSMKNSQNNTYQYRTLDQASSIANTGITQKDISASSDEFFPYSGSLTGAQLRDIMVVPDTDIFQNVAITGTLDFVTGSNTALGTNTSFLSELAIGDYLQCYSNASTSQILQIHYVNSTAVVFSNALSFTNAVGTGFRCFPAGRPAPFGYRSGLSGNVDANSNILTLDFGMRFSFSGSANSSMAVNIERRNVTQNAKTPNRQKFVKIAVANNAGGVNGPWCLGVPDIFRLRNVYHAGNSSVTEGSNNVTSFFYADHNQTLDFLDLGWLFLKPKSALSLTSGDYLLVEFDYFTGANGGFFDAISYVSGNATQRTLVDSLPLSGLANSSTISSWEIPSLVAPDGTYVDLMQHYDFRFAVANTVEPASNAASAPINPSNTVSFGNTADPALERKFPLPESTLSCVLTSYEGRIDSMFLGSDGKIFHREGQKNGPNQAPRPPVTPAGSMKISDVIVPAYPTLPQVRSSRILEILNTRVANETWLKRRLQSRTIRQPQTSRDVVNQPRAYTMEDIAKIDNRVKNLETYVTLTAKEGDLATRIIPSSVDPTLDRFKYGIFVNDFKDYLNLDNKNPQFAAIIEDDDLVPEKMTWSVPFEGISGPGDYIDYLVSNQENASEAANAAPPPCIPASNVGYVEYALQQDPRAGVHSIHKRFGTNSAQATLYVCIFGWPTDALHILQTSAAYTTQYELTNYNTIVSVDYNDLAETLPLTDADKAYLTGPAVGNWFADIPAAKLNESIHAVGTEFSGAFKIVWNYNPALGRDVTIRFVTQNRDFINWKAVLVAPFDREAVGCFLEGEDFETVVPSPQIVSALGCSNGPMYSAIDLDDLAGVQNSWWDTYGVSSGASGARILKWEGVQNGKKSRRYGAPGATSGGGWGGIGEWTPGD